MAKSRHQITGPKTIIQSIKVNIISIVDHHYMQCKVFVCKILSLQKNIFVLKSHN